jgi:hypothetical protein
VPSTPKAARVRIFFGALNRKPDWQPLQQALIDAALQLADEIEWVVVHDREFFEMLPPTVQKRFKGTVPPAEFMQTLAACDVALLPLSDTPFNRLKSDLKFIESCAAGAVPICSPVVYAARTEHHDIGVFATEPSDWFNALMMLCRQHDQLAQRRERGQAYVKAHRMHGQLAARREAVYRDWLARQAELEALRQQRMAAT